MTLRVRVCRFALVLTAVMGTACRAEHGAVPPVTLESLADGVSIPKGARFSVEDIRIGAKSVRSLFQPTSSPYPSVGRLTWNAGDAVMLTAGEGQLARLQAVLTEENAKSLRMVLKDPNPGGIYHALRVLASMRPASLRPRFEDEIDIPIAASAHACDMVTRVVFRRINHLVKKTVERAGQTGKPVSLGEVFALLLDERVDSFIDILAPDDARLECVRILELLKWINGETLTGFGDGPYRVERRFQHALDAVAEAILAIQADAPYQLIEIETVGFGDQRPVKDIGIPLTYANAGIRAWELSTLAPVVTFAGCSGDLLTGDAPVFVSRSELHHQRVALRIENNCELGAVRSALISRYLEERLGYLRGRLGYLEARLGDSRVTLRYATGGVNADERTDAGKRKVEIRMRVQTGRELLAAAPQVR